MLFFLGGIFIGAVVGSSIVQALVLSLDIFQNHRQDLLKLTMAPGFLTSAFLCGLVSMRFLPAKGHLYASTVPAILALPIILQILAAPLFNLSLDLFPPGDLFYRLMDMLKPTGHPLDITGAFLSIVIVGPICEEFVFRGVMMERALREQRNVHLVVILQALIFGLAHMNPWQFFYAVAFGALFGYLRVWTGGILLTCILHMLVNGISILTGYLDIPFFEESMDGSPIPVEIWIVVLALIIGAITIWPAYRNRPGSDRSSAQPET